MIIAFAVLLVGSQLMAQNNIEQVLIAIEQNLSLIHI